MPSDTAIQIYVENGKFQSLLSVLKNASPNYEYDVLRNSCGINGFGISNDDIGLDYYPGGVGIQVQLTFKTLRPVVMLSGLLRKPARGEKTITCWNIGLISNYDEILAGATEMDLIQVQRDVARDNPLQLEKHVHEKWFKTSDTVLRRAARKYKLVNHMNEFHRGKVPYQ